MMKLVSAAALTMGLASGAAFAEVPALSTNYLAMNLSQDECFERAKQVMQKAGHNRIERIGQSVFADSPDDQYQLVIRCVAAHQIAFFVAAGREPGPAEKLADRLNALFRDSSR